MTNETNQTTEIRPFQTMEDQVREFLEKADDTLFRAPCVFWTLMQGETPAQRDRLFDLYRAQWRGRGYGEAAFTRWRTEMEQRYRADPAACQWDTGIPQTRHAPSILMPLSGVACREAEYLLPPYLPQGMVSILGGVSGVGKTWLALEWAAAVSRQRRPAFVPESAPAPCAGYVFYFTHENDPGIVLRRRLEMMGANLNRILIQRGAAGDAPLTLNDPRLENEADLHMPSLVVFDPIQSYLGAGVDMNRVGEVRPVLDWLGDFAARHECAVLLVSHMSKPSVMGGSALDRLLGSSDFRNAARSILIVGSDPEEEGGQVFVHAKNSLGAPGESQRYHIDPRQGVVYDGPCGLTAEEVVGAIRRRGARNSPTLDYALGALQGLLGETGYISMEQFQKLQESCGVSPATMFRARSELRLQSVRTGLPHQRRGWLLRPELDRDAFVRAQNAGA